MSQMTAFIEQAKSDGELMSKLDALGAKGAGAEEVIALAAEYGFAVTKEDMEAARRQNCPHHGELSEAELDTISGGWTKDQYEPKFCPNLTSANDIRCRGNFILLIPPCDHFKSEKIGGATSRTFHESCAMGCFNYKVDVMH